MFCIVSLVASGCFPLFAFCCDSLRRRYQVGPEEGRVQSGVWILIFDRLTTAKVLDRSALDDHQGDAQAANDTFALNP
jgi:hypothetical protein